MKQDAAPRMAEMLLGWYDKNARVLPWRSNPLPYWVWVSEIMLQQTRVEAAITYFERFLAELPTVESLAAADDRKLLKLWEGLGYYNRVRNMKKAAGILVERYGGHIPADSKELQKLPGIGSYTAGAIASIAFGERVPAIDGNVLRVISRLYASKEDISVPAVKNKIMAKVVTMLPESRVGDFNQALMDLGATVCLPNGAPNCTECPWNTVCAALDQGLTEMIPVKAKKPARKIQKRTIFLIVSEHRAAIRQRPENGLLAGLWEFPGVEGTLKAEDCKKVLQDWKIPFSGLEPIGNAKHIFSHIEWRMTGFCVTAKNSDALGFRWVAAEELKRDYSIPSAFKAYLAAFLKSESGSV